MMIGLRTLLSSVLLGVLVAAPARGNILFVAPDYLKYEGSMQITEDITFTVTKRDSVLCYFVFQNLVQTNDGKSTYVAVSPDLVLDISGSPAAPLNTTFVGNSTPAFGDVTVTDGYLTFANGMYPVTTGDAVILKAGTYVLSGLDGVVNPQVTQTFTGTMFLGDADGKMISNVVAVPEPSTRGLATAGLLVVVAIGLRRARQQAV